MKKCPFCAEEIQDEAIKCRFCNEFFNEYNDRVKQKKSKWCFSTPFLILSACTVGPFMLPLIWFHPKLGQVMKILITIIIVVLTWILTIMLQRSLSSLTQYFELLQGIY